MHKTGKIIWHGRIVYLDGIGESKFSFICKPSSIDQAYLSVDFTSGSMWVPQHIESDLAKPEFSEDGQNCAPVAFGGSSEVREGQV